MSELSFLLSLNYFGSTRLLGKDVQIAIAHMVTHKLMNAACAVFCPFHCIRLLFADTHCFTKSQFPFCRKVACDSNPRHCKPLTCFNCLRTTPHTSLAHLGCYPQSLFVEAYVKQQLARLSKDVALAAYTALRNEFTRTVDINKNRPVHGNCTRRTVKKRPLRRPMVV